MPNNIDASLRALCQAQESKIKAQQHTLGQLQLGCASLGTLASQYKSALDSCIKVLENMLDPESVYQATLERAKAVSASNGRGPADAILALVQEKQRISELVYQYQTNQDQLEAKVKELETKLAQYETGKA